MVGDYYATVKNKEGTQRPWLRLKQATKLKEAKQSASSIYGEGYLSDEIIIGIGVSDGTIQKISSRTVRNKRWNDL
jgi:hypothetical protein